MSLYIVEPSLRDRGGHHFEFAATIAAAARSSGDQVTILAHKDCSAENADGVKVVPWFSNHVHENVKSVLGYGISNFLYFNASIYRDLKRLHKNFRFHHNDTVLFPTLSENQLSGVVRWAEKLKVSDSPLLIIYLMFSPNFWPSDFRQFSTEALPTERALFYKLALHNAMRLSSTIKIFAGGGQIAREFSALAKFQIKSHPLPLSTVSTSLRNRKAERPRVLLYAGVARWDKGFLFLSDLADRVSLEHPTHQFMIHVDFSGLASTQPEMCSAFEKLNDLNSNRDNIEVRTGILSRAEYLAFIGLSDYFVCTYDPVTYARRTSGVVWEAISLGLPILAPANTFIEREAAEWGAGFSVYSTWSAAGISEAYTAFIKTAGDLSVASRSASERFNQANGNAALVEHLAQSKKTAPATYSSNPINALKSSRLYLVAAWLRFRIGQMLRRPKLPSC